VANLVLVLDPDADRRTRFIASTRLSPVEGLRSEQCTFDDFCAAWAQERRAPVSRIADAQGIAILWGDAILPQHATRADASALRTAWADPDSAPVFDGFHAAAVYDRQLGLCVGTDALGLFPLYYWSSHGVVLIGSSPELFRHHPLFRMKLSPAGLVGILLTSHLVDGQTLLEGVRRLAAGALLVSSSGKQPTEIVRYRLPVSRRYFARPFSEHLDILDRVLSSATSRHVRPEARHTLLLSGGLDSRMLGGYLAPHATGTVALTFGQSSDLEVAAARRVAKALGFPHRTTDVPFAEYPLCAERQMQWEHLSNGFSTIRTWGLPAVLQHLPPTVIAGYLSDKIVGGPSVLSLPRRHGATPSFDTSFAVYNKSGLSPEILKGLLRLEIFGTGLIEHTIERLREQYESYSDIGSQCAWCFELAHRQRFHVGGITWRLSFGAWPLLPVVDQAVLEALGGMPATTITRRRAQKELVCRRFPALAALPLDRNSYDTRPLQCGPVAIAAGYARQQWFRALAAVPSPWQQERRYYYRIYDINNEGWRAVRASAEPHRTRVLPLFHGRALDALLPPPDTSLHCKDAIIDSSGTKLLLGLLLWSADHL
jgi:asparagine synthase (glutamine-hydrolysing)